MSFQGHVASVEEDVRGDELVEDVAAGATVLPVYDVVDFDETGGQVVIAETIYTYSEVDDDAQTLTLTTPLAADAFEGDRVDVWNPATGTTVTEWVAVVTDDLDGSAITAPLAHALITFLGDGVYGIQGESVLCEADPETDEWMLVQVIGKTPVFDAQYVLDGSLTVTGTFTTGDDPNGTSITLDTAVNPFESGQNWATARFNTGLPGWNGGLIWGWDNNTDEAALRLSSPHNPAATGTDPWYKAALLDLRAHDDGTTDATLYADDLKLRGKSFTIESADGQAADFNLINTDVLQIRGQNRHELRVTFSGLDNVRLMAWDADELERRHMIYAAQNHIFDIGGTTQNQNLTMLAEAGSSEGWLGRFDGSTGLAFGTARVRAQNYLGAQVPIQAASFPTSSDAALKDDIAELDGAEALAIVRGISPSTYIWKATGEHKVGFIAQDVREHIPSAVVGEDGELAVDPYPLNAANWRATQVIDERVTELEQTVAEQADQIAALTAAVQQLQAANPGPATDEA